MPMLKRPAAALSGSSKAKTLVAKKQRIVDPLEQQCASVLAGLKEAVVPLDVSKMMAAMLGIALKEAKEERHAIQASVVDMAGTLMSATEAEMAEEVATSTGAVSDLEAQQATKEGAVAKAEDMVKAAQDVAQAQKRALAAVATDFQSRRKALEAAQAEGEAVARRQAEAAAKKEKLQEARASLLRPLIEGDGVEGKTMQELVEALSGVSRDFGIDDSILVALPNAACKPPSERGAFDTMVLVQLEAEFGQRAEGAEAQTREDAAAAAAAAEAERTAAAALEDAKAKQLASAQEFRSAAEDRDRAEASRDEASGDLCSVYPQMRRREKERAAGEKRLAGFRDGPLAAFVALRDRAAPPPPPEPAADEQSAEQEPEFQKDAEEGGEGAAPAAQEGGDAAP